MTSRLQLASRVVLKSPSTQHLKSPSFKSLLHKLLQFSRRQLNNAELFANVSRYVGF
jgi:hypothetical protein